MGFIKSFCMGMAGLFMILILAGASPERKNSLAVFNLRPTNIEAMVYNTDILYALIAAIEKDKAVEVMPRRVMEGVLYNAGLSQGDNLKMALKGGKALGVNYVLFGRVTKSGNNITAELELLDVEQGEVVKRFRRNFTGRRSIIDNVPAFAREVVTNMVDRPRQLGHKKERPSQGRVEISDFKATNRGRKVHLTWVFDPSQPITAFTIYRSRSAKGPYELMGRATKNSFFDKKIKKGRSYFYRLGIVLSSGKEIKSIHTAFIQNAGEKTPYPPLVIGKKGFVRRAVIKFVSSLQNEKERFKIRSYEIYRKGIGEGEMVLIAKLDAGKKKIDYLFEDTTNLSDGETYIYAIASVDKKKRKSPMSDPIEIKTTGRPVLISGKDNLLRRVDISWERLGDVRGYRVYREAREGSVREHVGTVRGAEATFHSDKKGLRDGAVYHYYITAYDDKGETGPSKGIRAKTKEVPGHPDDIKVQSGMVKSAWISWSPKDDPDVGGYSIYRGVTKKKAIRIARVKGVASMSYTDKGTGFNALEDGREYYYSVASFNLFKAEGPISRPVMAKTKPRPLPVRSFTAFAEESRIIVKWDANPEPDIDRYVLYRIKNKGFWSKIRTFGTGELMYKDFELKPEASYRYKIIAVDRDNLKSDPVESLSVPGPLVKE